jgi:hypothetical protein
MGYLVVATPSPKLPGVLSANEISALDCLNMHTPRD